jgi:argininosuccinate synthase
VTFGADDVYRQSDAAGFIRLFGLSTRVQALRDRERAVAEEAAKAKSKLAVA